jgi:hypothetical protein
VALPLGFGWAGAFFLRFALGKKSRNIKRFKGPFAGDREAQNIEIYEDWCGQED